MAVDIAGFGRSLRMDEKIGGMLDDYQRQRNIEREMANRERASALANEAQGLQNEQARMSLAALRRQQDVDRMAREAYAGARPVTTLNPAYVSPEQFSLAATAGPPTAREYITPEFEQGMTDQKGYEYQYPGQGVAPQDIARLQNLKPESFTKPADPYGAMADVYAREGDMQGLKETISIQDMLAKTKAKGDPVEFEKSKNLLDNYSNFYKQVADLRKEGTPNALAQAQKISEVYQYMNKDNADMFDISDWEERPDGIYNPQYLTDGTFAGYFVHDDSGVKFVQAKPDKAVETWGKPYDTEIGGKKIRVQDSSTGQQRMIAGDTSTTVKVGVEAPKGKPMPDAIQGRLLDIGKDVDSTEHLNATFKPEYAGMKSKTIADGVLEATKRFGADSPAAAFWMTYQERINAYRKGLFGSALTPQEKSEFEKAIINPAMNPDLIKSHLATQERLIKKAAARTAALNVKTYGKDTVESAIGRDLTSLPDPKGSGYETPAEKQTATAPKGPKIGTVEDGYRYKGGNPKEPSSWVKVGK